jgi:hypothetical protein
MRRRALVSTISAATAAATLAAVLAVAACSGDAITGLDQAVYNATYVGPATLQNPLPSADPPAVPPPLHISMTMSQLGQDFTGSFFLADSTGRQVYSGSVTGKTTNTGANFTFVVPAPCAGTLHGSFTVANSELSGSATGRDCTDIATGTNIRITFTNLVRQ